MSRLANVARALVPAAPRLVSGLRVPAKKRVETSLDPAGMSARATSVASEAT